MGETAELENDRVRCVKTEVAQEKHPWTETQGCSLRVPCRDSSRCLVGLTQYRRSTRSHNNDSREGIERSRCVKQPSRAIDLSTARFVT